MEAHKDFGDLLLFICLLDSQDIPRDLLEFYKNEVTASNFFITSKKYSLITDKHQSLLAGKTISLHESTQKIGLTYLTKLLDLEKNPHWQQEISTVLEKYSAEAIEREGIIKDKTSHFSL